MQAESVSRNQSGVGLFLKVYPEESEFPVVGSLVEGGPAESSGQITAGDFLISVNGTSTAKSLLHDVKSRIVGEPGTEVILGFKRKTEEFTCKLVRHKVLNLMEDMRSYVDAFVRRQEVENVREVFQKWMIPGKQGIEPVKLRRALQDLHIVVEENDVDQKFHEMDTNQDGIIDFSEFRFEVQKLNKIEKWTSSMPVHQLVAGALMPIVVRHQQLHPKDDPLRAVAKCEDEDLKLVSKGIMEGCLKLLKGHVKKLREAFKAVDEHENAAVGCSEPELASKFTFRAETMSCGTVDAFFEGLGERVGHPNLDLMKGMEQEHCELEGWNTGFTTSNYGLHTTPKQEWDIVINHKKEFAKGDRVIPNYKELMKSSAVQEARLQDCEVIAIILYSGPMFQIYNGALRRFPVVAPESVTRTGSCIAEHNLYPTTIHCLVSAITKISRITKLPKDLVLYRGLGGVLLPDCKASPCGFNCFVEWGFMSTTSDKEVAIRYTGVGKGKAFPTLLMVRSAAVDHGADIRAFSQYPREEEYLWNPLSLVEPHGEPMIEATEHGIVTILPVRMNMNVKTMTVDELKQCKKTMHLNSFRYMLHQTQVQLREQNQTILARVQKKEQGGGQPRVDLFLDSVIAQCKEVLVAHEKHHPEKYIDSMFYRKMVIEMLDINMFARSKVLVYILDNSAKLESLMKEKLRAGHRRYASFLERQFVQQKGDKLQGAALRLCKVKGLLSTDTSDDDELIDELKRVNELGEPRIVSAAAEGLSSDCLKLLVASKASINATDPKGFTGIMSAASVGNERAIRTLAREHGADCGKVLWDGTDAVMLAAREGHASCIKTLAGLGARLDCVAPDTGRTALIEAAISGHADCVRELATLIKAAGKLGVGTAEAERAGAGKGRRDAHGSMADFPDLNSSGVVAEKTADKTEEERGTVGVSTGSVPTGGVSTGGVPFVDHRDKEGYSALMHAAKFWHVDAIKQLDLFGATVDTAALVIARRSGEGKADTDDYYNCIKKLVELQWIPEVKEKVRVLVNGDRRDELQLEAKPERKGGKVIEIRPAPLQYLVEFPEAPADGKSPDSDSQAKRRGRWFPADVVRRDVDKDAQQDNRQLAKGDKVKVDMRQLRPGKLERKDDSACPFYVSYTDAHGDELRGWFARADVFRADESSSGGQYEKGSWVALQREYREELRAHLKKNTEEKSVLEEVKEFKGIKDLKEAGGGKRPTAEEVGKVKEVYQSMSGWTRLFFVNFACGRHDGWYSSQELEPFQPDAWPPGWPPA